MFKIRGYTLLISCIITITIALLQGCASAPQDYKQADNCFWKCANARATNMEKFPDKVMWQKNCEVVLEHMADGWNWLCVDGDTRTYWEKCQCIRFYESNEMI